MNTAALGVSLTVFAGIMLGAFALPTKRVRTWSWEHTWLAFSVIALIVMPLITAVATIPDLGAVWAGTKLEVILAVAGFGALWGCASIGYGLGVRLAGIAIANAVILGLNNAIGSILPIVIYQPGKLRTAQGLGVTAGVLVMIAGIAAAARAGFLRDRVRSGEAAGGPGKGTAGAWKGLGVCLGAGVLGAFFNFALISGKPIEAVAVDHGASPSYAPNATWPIALGSGCLVAVVYCVYLMVRKRNARDYFAAGAGVNWLYAFLMAFLWYGGVMVYGIAVTKLGGLGASVGWAVLQSITVGTGAVLGFLTGEWRAAGRRTITLLLAGLATLVLGIVIVVGAGTLISP